MTPKRYVFDTSIIVAKSFPADAVGAISVVTLAELEFGVLAASGDPVEQALRITRLATVEATFNPIVVSAEIARIWGQLAGLVNARGGQPRKRQFDLLIAATAVANKVPLLTHNVKDFTIIADRVQVVEP